MSKVIPTHFVGMHAMRIVFWLLMGVKSLAKKLLSSDTVQKKANTCTTWCYINKSRNIYKTAQSAEFSR